MKSDIRIYNIKVENKYYNYDCDCDDPRYDVNDKIKSINKEYIYNNIEINDFNYDLEDYLEEICKEYCNKLLDTTLDNIIICCDIDIITNDTKSHYKISFDYNSINSIKIFDYR